MSSLAYYVKETKDGVVAIEFRLHEAPSAPDTF